MTADASFYDYVHPGHFMLFVEAARKFNCHILLRKTGAASISWMGKPGYTGKRGDLKAKTADLNAGRHPVAGLVCSPLLRPESFTPERLAKARELWLHDHQLITEPRDTTGFDERQQPNRCTTPYLVQTNPDSRHFGCVALVESGLLLPRYVHGDYDLFAIIPAGQAFDAETAYRHASERRMGTTVAPGHLGLAKREQRQLANYEGPLAFRIANFLNVRIASTHPDMVGSLMVNHGEEVSWRRTKPDPAALYLSDGLRNKPDILEPVEYQPVLAIMPRMVGGQWGMILRDRKAHERFYLGA